MNIFGMVIEKTKKPTQRRPGNRTLKKRVDDAANRLILKRVEDGDPVVCQALIEKGLGRELPKLDPIASVIAQKKSTFVVKGIDSILEKPGVAESMGKQMLERYLDVDLTPAPDASHTTPQLSPFDDFLLKSRQRRAIMEELGIGQGGVRGFLQGLINADTVNGVLKLVGIAFANKATPTTGFAEAQAPIIPPDNQQQVGQVSPAEADQVDPESLSREIQSPLAEPTKNCPAPGHFRDLGGYAGYLFKAADTDVGDLNVSHAARPLKQSNFRPEPPTPSSN